MGKRLLNSVITVLILLGVFCVLVLLNSDKVEAGTANTVTINTPLTKGVINGTFNLSATVDKNVYSIDNITECIWYYSSDSGANWVSIITSLNNSGTPNKTSFSNVTDTTDTTYWAVGDYENLHIKVDCYNASGTLNCTDTNTGVDLDNDDPTVSAITIPDKREIRYVTNPIEIECIGSDPGDTQQIIMKLTKPRGITVENVVTKPMDWKHVFKYSDTNEAGLYHIDCKTEAKYGNNRSGAWWSQQSFRVLYEDIGVEEEVEEKPVAKLDISTKEVYSGTLFGKQGESKTFTLDGVTAHTLEFVEVTFTSATLRLESDSVEITLDVGKYKNADLDGDGVDDVKVTLESIDEDGRAKVEIINLAKLEEIAKEEREAKMPKVEEEPSRAGLWITILVILVVVAVGYYLLKKKKGKKGQVKFSKQDLGL